MLVCAIILNHIPIQMQALYGSAFESTGLQMFVKGRARRGQHSHSLPNEIKQRNPGIGFDQLT